MILVTGHLGFVGRHLMRRLGGAAVVGLDRNKPPGSSFRDLMNCKLPEADRVYHLAAQTDAQCVDATLDAQQNIMGTLRLLERYGSRVVLASTSMVNYPLLPYAISKGACEAYAKMYGAAIVRFPNLYGDGGHSVVDVFRRAETMEIRGTGQQKRTYAKVEDAVEALLDARAGTLTVLPGEHLTVNQVADMYPDKPRVFVPGSDFDPDYAIQLPV